MGKYQTVLRPLAVKQNKTGGVFVTPVPLFRLFCLLRTRGLGTPGIHRQSGEQCRNLRAGQGDRALWSTALPHRCPKVVDQSPERELNPENQPILSLQTIS